MPETSYIIDKPELAPLEDKIRAGLPVEAEIRDETFARHLVKAIILAPGKEAPGSPILWVEDWKGHREELPWSIRILEFLD